MYIFLLILQSTVCSPLSVKYSTIEMITISSSNSSSNLSVKPFPSLHTAYVFINSFSSYCDKNIRLYHDLQPQIKMAVLQLQHSSVLPLLSNHPKNQAKAVWLPVRVTAVTCKNRGHSAKSAGGRSQLITHAPYVCGFE